MVSTTKRLVVLISGTGSALQAILDATRWEALDAEVAHVISHEPWSYGLLRAEKEGIDTTLHDLADYRAGVDGKLEADYVSDLADIVAESDPDLVILAGWKYPLSEEFGSRFARRIINLQPGLPGQFPLFDPYAQNPVSRAYEAYNAGLIRETHVTVQVLENMSTSGRVIAQESVPIYDFDTLVDLEERMSRTEQEVLINTLKLLLREQEEHYNNYQ